jgi:hypothetical protein
VRKVGSSWTFSPPPFSHQLLSRGRREVKGAHRLQLPQQRVEPPHASRVAADPDEVDAAEGSETVLLLFVPVR